MLKSINKSTFHELLMARKYKFYKNPLKKQLGQLPLFIFSIFHIHRCSFGDSLVQAIPDTLNFLHQIRFLEADFGCQMMPLQGVKSPSLRDLSGCTLEQVLV